MIFHIFSSICVFRQNTVAAQLCAFRWLAPGPWTMLRLLRKNKYIDFLAKMKKKIDFRDFPDFPALAGKLEIYTQSSEPNPALRLQAPCRRQRRSKACCGRARPRACYGRARTNPRNPRHVNIIEGGRKRVSTIFMDKNSVSCA